MRTKLYLLAILAQAYVSQSFGQHAGIFAAPNAMLGYNNISAVYHPYSSYAPKNKGFNYAFQVGLVAGYKLEHAGIQFSYNRSYFEQNFDSQNIVGNLAMNANSFGISALYQLGKIGQTRYFHTLKFGYIYSQPEEANYKVQDAHNNDVYGDTTMLYALQNNHAISVEYGITTGYKLLWADFSVKAAYNISNIYKPLTDTNGKNFFIGVSLSFGLFLYTNK